MSDKFGWLRGVLMVSPVPRRVMSRSLTGGVKGEMRRKLVFLCHCVCMCARACKCVSVPILLLSPIRKSWKEGWSGRTDGDGTRESDYGSDEARRLSSRRMC